MSEELVNLKTEVVEDTQPDLALYRQSDPGELIFRDEGDPIVEGKVVPYNEWVEVDSIVEGHFMERFAPGSLTKTFGEQLKRMKGYFEHGHSRMFDSMPIMDIREAWDNEEGGFFRADLLKDVPALLTDGLRRGMYGASIGAKVIKMNRNRRPEVSDHNPQGLEERTYTEVRAFDISITPRPHYATQVALRSITDDLLIEKLMEDPNRLRDLILARAEDETPEPTEESEPQHSGREEQEDPAPERSRSTQPTRDYLRPKEGAPSWRL